MTVSVVSCKIPFLPFPFFFFFNLRCKISYRKRMESRDNRVFFVKATYLRSPVITGEARLVSKKQSVALHRKT